MKGVKEFAFSSILPQFHITFGEYSLYSFHPDYPEYPALKSKNY